VNSNAVSVKGGRVANRATTAASMGNDFRDSFGVESRTELRASLAHAIGTGGFGSRIFRSKRSFVMPPALNFIPRIMNFL
jgi:hypothetical protein